MIVIDAEIIGATNSPSSNVGCSDPKETAPGTCVRLESLLNSNVKFQKIITNVGHNVAVVHIIVIAFIHLRKVFRRPRTLHWPRIWLVLIFSRISIIAIIAGF